MHVRTLTTRLDTAQTLEHVSQQWDRDIVGQLKDYIAIPAKSPMFAPDWAAQGLLDTVLRNAASWVEAQKVPGLKLEIVRIEGRTPVLFFEVQGTADGANAADANTVLMYGHLDKQPEFEGWRSDLGPWTPVYEDGKLYGRGGADDGYAVYASVAAVQELKRQNVPHPRIVGIIETAEESGSRDLLPYVDALRPRLGKVELVICLDSGAGNYDQLWQTTSLRGMASGTLKIEILTERLHSRQSSDVLTASFRVLRQVLDRLEDSHTGRLLPQSFYSQVPLERLTQIRTTAEILGQETCQRFPRNRHDCLGQALTLLPSMEDPVQALLKATWDPTLKVSINGGVPMMFNTCEHQLPYTAFNLHLSLPPLVDPAACVHGIKTLLEDNAPYYAKVTWGWLSSLPGWNAPDMTPWFENALQAASRAYFGADCGYIGQGGTIPLMNLLSQGFPTAQMMVCGVLGPKSNAHGPNEFLHVPYAKKLTAAVAQVVAAMPVSSVAEASA